MQKNIDIDPQYTQGTAEWCALRKTKITATDACIIMGMNPWKSRAQLLSEKLSDDPATHPTERMQRGLDLEDTARELFCIRISIKVYPRVVVKGWIMASMDGVSEDDSIAVEIKCPGDKDHRLALDGQVPDHYYPQLQHQMYVCNLPSMYYFSFDGFDGVEILVERDDEYILKMIDEEWKFYQILMAEHQYCPFCKRELVLCICA